MDEWEGTSHGNTWAHMAAGNEPGVWVVHVVDETTRQTLTAYLDLRDLARLAVFVTRQLARAATAQPGPERG